MAYRQLIFNLVVAFSMLVLGLLVAKSDAAGLGLVAIATGLILLSVFSFRVEKRKAQRLMELTQAVSVGDSPCR
ncbi:hypothetical protein [Shewanella sp. TC10]|uniref:hypothetical protein n=1 Tax=Shewanella sp. TC10 TaxID=1419739 RepID=UPI00129E4C89|nr:hypothetical protein [Shewanella sp. TC10]